MDRMEMALLNALGKTRKMYETVNLEELVEKAGLLGLQPPEARVVRPPFACPCLAKLLCRHGLSSMQ